MMDRMEDCWCITYDSESFTWWLGCTCKYKLGLTAQGCKWIQGHKWAQWCNQAQGHKWMQGYKWVQDHKWVQGHKWAWVGLRAWLGARVWVGGKAEADKGCKWACMLIILVVGMKEGNWCIIYWQWVPTHALVPAQTLAPLIPLCHLEPCPHSYPLVLSQSVILKKIFIWFNFKTKMCFRTLWALSNFYPHRLLTPS